MKFGFIAQQRVLYPTVVLCRVMGVSRSGFYDYLARRNKGPGGREQEDALLLAAIRDVFVASGKRYGSPRIHAKLKKRGITCSLRRVKRLMQQAGLYALPKRKYQRRTWHRTPPGTANLLTPKPAITHVNQVWYSDITFVKTHEGWLYLAAVMDAYSKRIIGYALATHMKTELVLQALRMARTARRPPTGLIHHSDKGSQFTSYAYARELASSGIRASFTGTGACLDNAYIESFFATLKKELVYQTTFATRKQAASAIKDFILMYYNSWRLHSSLGYLCPNDFESGTTLDLAA